MRQEIDNTLEHTFAQLEDIHTDHPQSRETPVWYGYKLEEEVGEFQLEAHNDPNNEQWERMASELDDVFITTVGAYIALGISADVALLRVGAKLLTVRDRFASGHYDENPRLKRYLELEDHHADAYHTDYMADYE